MSLGEEELDLNDILERDDSNFRDSDEFDPDALLSEPIFDDSQGDLDVNLEKYDYGVQPPETAPVSETSSASSFATNNTWLP